MIEIKSLKRITEAAADEHDKRYESDVAKAHADYDKVGGSRGPLSFKRGYDWGIMPGRNKELGSAKYDLQTKLDAAESRRKAGKQGFVTKQDAQDSQFEAAKSKTSAVAKARESATKVAKATGENKADDHPGVLRKIGGAVADHPYLAAGTVAGLAGLAMMQKRKNRLPEPGSYNQGV